MPTTERSATHIDEIADGIYRISTPVPPDAIPGGFSFNQYLVLDEEPLLFHTGPRRTFPAVCEALQAILPLARLRYLAFSHFESDECGAMNLLLAAAPEAAPLCSRIDAMVNADAFDRSPRGLADGEAILLGRHAIRWLEAPHVPHGWGCGYLVEEHTGTLLCGDLFTQPGTGDLAITNGDILGPSEALRARLDYFSHTDRAPALLERLAARAPRALACMHGSAWEGDGAALLRELGAILGREQAARPAHEEMGEAGAPA